jgi:hypothetical protein
MMVQVFDLGEPIDLATIHVVRITPLLSSCQGRAPSMRCLGRLSQCTALFSNSKVSRQSGKPLSSKRLREQLNGSYYN